MDLHTQDLSGVPATIRTERLTLRPLVEADRAAVKEQVGDFDVAKMLTQVPHPYTDADFDTFLDLRDSRDFGIIWIVADSDGLCGVISVGTELGYWLGKAVWGRGYATEAGQAVVDAVFTHSDRPMIRSSHFEENGGSQRVLEKLGFEDVGGHLHFSAARSDEVEGRSMLLTRSRWSARRG